MSYDILEGAICEVQYRYKLQGQQLINVFHYKFLGGSIDGRAAAVDIAENFDVLVGADIRELQTTDVTEIHVRAQWVYPTRYAYVEFLPGIRVGTQAPPTLSIGTSVVLKKLADLAGHSHRGRAYIGGLPVDYADIGLVKDANFGEILALATNMTILLPALAGANLMQPVIWSYTDPTNADYIVNTSADKALRYQRRREVGRGE